MRNFLEYQPQSIDGKHLASTPIEHGDSTFSGNTEFRYQESYTVTKGIRKGLVRFQSLGFIPDTLQPCSDAFLELGSNNLLPGLVGDDGTAQFVKFRGGTSISDPRESLRTDILVSQCIFGVTGNRLILDDGSVVPMTSPKSAFTAKVVEVETDDHLSFYETESIERQGQLVKALVENNSKYVSATVSLPRVGYYLHALKPYETGMINPEHAIKWFDAVDRRFSIVLDAVKDSLNGLIPIRVVTPLNEIDETLRKMVISGKPMQLEPLLGKLASSDVLWKKILQTTTPNGIYQLKGDFADAVDELRLPNEADSRLIVKSPKEEGTFELKDSLAQRAKLKAPLIAMYALPQVVTLAAGKGLYQIDQNPTTIDRQLIAKHYSQ